MEPGTPVIYYRHEQSDDNHWAVDFLGLVIKDHGPQLGADLVVFPVGGPIEFVRAFQYSGESSPGKYWFRPTDEAAPDLGPPTEEPAEVEEDEDDAA